uniref:Uncharacterized protein n=1 Tax=Oryza glumipatula TaxID=40148 RepID=A0A0E0B9J6_9ORYZ
MEEAPAASTSLGAMGSLLRKLPRSPPSPSPSPSLAWLPREAMDEVNSLRGDLEENYAFLRELSELEEPTMTEKCWMKQVRELSYDVEDMLDMAILAGARAGADAVTLIAGKVSEFRERAQGASQRRTRYGVCHPTSSRRRCSSSSSSSAINDHRFADVGAADEIAGWLMKGGEERRLKVVGIVGGAGGIGKTTLAREVYRRLGGQFERRAFVRMAEKTNTRRLLRDMLSQLGRRQPGDACDTPELVDHIREHLHRRRYIVIVDDVWAISLWNSICRAFPEDNNCSRIIVTSQIEEIAGFPLAVLNTASLLACQPKLLEQQWHDICNSLATNLRSSTSEVTKHALNLNYNNLPHYIKTCLLYFNIYPSDYMILKEDLVKQWVAEGFINSTNEQDMEEIAGNYFDELVNRRMIQPVDINYDDEVLSCTVHSMVHDLIAYKSIEDNFIVVLDNSENTIEISEDVRRLSLHFGNARYANIPESISLSQVRSLAFFGLFNCLPLITEFEAIRVLILHVCGDKCGTIVDLSRIGELRQLRYLKISCDSRIKLPIQVSGLYCLETLKIEARSINFPSDIVHLSHLLHLSLHGEADLPDMIGQMISLRTLRGYFDPSSSLESVQNLTKLTNLKDLHLTCSTAQSVRQAENMECFGSIVLSLTNLRSVTLVPGFLHGKSTSRTSSTACMSWVISNPPHLLQRLELSPHICTFSRLPNWVGELGMLCNLKIAVKELRRIDVDVLGGLHALTLLSLYVKKVPEERIVFHTAKFPVLKYLKFGCSVACLTFEEGTMPDLQSFILCFCAQGAARSGHMPTGMEHLLSLEVLTAHIERLGANELDTQAAESALKNIIDVHGTTLVINVCWVDQAENSDESNTKEEDQPEKEYPFAKNNVNSCGNIAQNLRHQLLPSMVGEFCKALGGDSPIHSVLVASNGMAAVKFIRSIRIWNLETFGLENAILLVAMATPEDLKMNAEHIRIADKFVEVPGGTNNNNYANVQLIVEIAERTQVSAVWPGWGHASENPELPDALNETRIIFLGPPSTAMAPLGDTISSYLIAQAEGIPTFPWSGSKVKLSPESYHPIPEEIYKSACVSSTEEAVASCQVVGYPAMIRASRGGGGKGIRMVHNDGEVRKLFKQVQGEVPGSPIFVIKVASESRHLEVQLLCDKHGNVAVLHSRDCTVQRRHQKIIDEGPITIAPPETVKELEQAASRFAKCVQYIGAATVEYLYNMETGQYYFLELNPQLQAQHPVTEWIAEVNLPAAQVAVGMGIPLYNIPDIRRFYGMEHAGGYDAWKKISALATKFDLDKAPSVRPKGHCVAVRVTSEDPDDGFKPTSGRVEELNFKSKPNVWAYFSIKARHIHPKCLEERFTRHVFAFGESRSLAIANLVLGLKEFQIRGEIRTNVHYAVDLLNAAEYRENNIYLSWLDSRIAMCVRADRPPWYISVVCGALYIEIVRGGPHSYRLRMNGSEIGAEMHSLLDGGLLIQLDGSSHAIYAQREAAGTRLLINGKSCLLQKAHDPSKLLAHTPCKLLRFLVADGSHVDADTPYAEVEVMKMCMPLLLPASGVIHFVMHEGQTIQENDLIARLDLDDTSYVRRVETYNGTFPKLGPPTVVSGKVHQKFSASVGSAQMILAGYEHNINQVVHDLLNCLDSPELPFLQWEELMSVYEAQLPEGLKNKENLAYCPDMDRLIKLIESYEGGREGHSSLVLKSLFEQYLSIEELFSNNIQSDVIKHLQIQHKNDLEKVVAIVFSHQRVRNKNKLILRLMEALVYPNPSAYRDQLIRFSALNHTTYSELALKASQLLEHTKLSELRTNIARTLSELEMFTEDGEQVSRPRRKIALNERMEDLVCAPLAVEDALVALFDHGDRTLQRRVVETYIHRLYQINLVSGRIRMQWHQFDLIASWEFFEGHNELRDGQDSIPLKKQVENPVHNKLGFMVVIKSLQFLSTVLEVAFKDTSQYKGADGNLSIANPVNTNQSNMLHIALVGTNNQMRTLQDIGDEDQAQERMNTLVKILNSNSVRSYLSGAGVRVISCIIQRGEGCPPMRHTYQWSVDKLCYEEDLMHRHVEPPLSAFLELDKMNLEGYNEAKYTPSRDRQWHIYTLVKKKKDLRSNDQRMFLRTIVRQPSANRGFLSGSIDNGGSHAQASSYYTSNSILRSLMGALDEIELHAHDETVRSSLSHMYLCILREQQLHNLIPFSGMMDDIGQDELTASTILKNMVLNIHKHVGVRMHRLYVCQWEVKLWLHCNGQASGAWRVVVTNVTNHTCTIDIYREKEDPNTHKIVYHTVASTPGPLHGVALHEPHKPFDAIDLKRYSARKNGTTYCYDFPSAFETALKKSWKSSTSGVAETNEHNQDHVKATELIFSDSTGAWGPPLVPVERSPGDNDVGIVAWSMKLSTPEFPSGREIIVVANDVTFKAGSFGPREDAFFDAVTNLACERKVPLIYLAATAGARLGVAEEIKSCFRVGWFDNESPELGFHYVYLIEQDYSRLSSSVIAHELKLDSGETRWVVDTIVGKEDGLGCENLRGSGAIASAYSKAYRETFTLTFVTGQAVGIGAYLARLGMRSIQRLDQPIILIGFPALNKLLGREVYSSHMELGGPKIMATNGVVHLTVSDDLEGVSAILKWLSYVPPYVGGPLPVTKPLDPPDRPVTYFPERSCDARAAICGIQGSQGKWLGGMFDRDSFMETLDGWARTVITGRARLGGIPVGVIAVETQTMMQVVPADPGQLDSNERVVPQAGQVLFPDSATKTAQALLDFNHEELPLFVLANWRGFSGGQRDLFDGILQAGSMIVENLRTYRQPVFVYIPMAGELRGGAWVVIDRNINPEHIEMYAERTAKGNVLEPEVLVKIPITFRPKELEECMLRLDPQLINLNTRLEEMRKKNSGASEMETIWKRLTARMEQLMPIYTQVATRFAELHDASARMAAKGVISKVVDWEDSRAFFYRRLRRRVAEEALTREVREAAGEQLSHQSTLEYIKKWFLASRESEGDSGNWNNDEAFFAWKDDPTNYENYLEELKAERVSKLFSHLSDLLNKINPSRRVQISSNAGICTGHIKSAAMYASLSHIGEPGARARGHKIGSPDVMRAETIKGTPGARGNPFVLRSETSCAEGICSDTVY